MVTKFNTKIKLKLNQIEDDFLMYHHEILIAANNVKIEYNERNICIFGEGVNLSYSRREIAGLKVSLENA